MARAAIEVTGRVRPAAIAPRATPRTTPSYALHEAGRPVAVPRGGSLLIGAAGRLDLVQPCLTEQLSRAELTSAHRVASGLPDETAVRGGVRPSAQVGSPGCSTGAGGSAFRSAERAEGMTQR